MLFLLEFFLYPSLNPYNASEKYKSCRREDYKSVIHVACIIERLRYKPYAEQFA